MLQWRLSCRGAVIFPLRTISKDFAHVSGYAKALLPIRAPGTVRGHFLARISMFTGIIEHLGTVDSLNLHADGGRLTIHAPSVAPHLAVANSIAVNGCCLTVVALGNERFSPDLSAVPMRKTCTAGWIRSLRVSLEHPWTR